jgi:phytoene/squalene synthetase
MTFFGNFAEDAQESLDEMSIYELATFFVESWAKESLIAQALPDRVAEVKAMALARIQELQEGADDPTAPWGSWKAYCVKVAEMFGRVMAPIMTPLEERYYESKDYDRAFFSNVNRAGLLIRRGLKAEKEQPK